MDVEKAYKEYLAKFARDRGITEEEAAEHRIVKEYKEYLEEGVCSNEG